VSVWDRFWTKVRIPVDGRGCWIWTAGKDDSGYGSFRYLGRMVGAHRFVYEECIGKIPAGKQIDHVRALGCTSRACVNPLHMEPVTQQENIARGDVGRPQVERTKCPHGHPYSAENTRVTVVHGYRRRLCKTCQRVDRLRRAAKENHVKA